MKYRPHRGGLAESMLEVVELDGSLAALEAHVRKTWPVGDIKVEPYGGYDKRIGWDTHIVTIDGSAVGFTDGPCG